MIIFFILRKLDKHLCRCPEESPIEVLLKNIRPHSSDILPLESLKTGDRVLMNYNIEYPKERGYWYDVLVKEIITNRRRKAVIGDVSVGINNALIKNCTLLFLDDIYNVKHFKLITERTPEDTKIMETKPAVMSNNQILPISIFINILYVHFFSKRSWTLEMHRLQRQ